MSEPDDLVWWFQAEDHLVHGPLAARDIRAMLAAGDLAPHTPVTRDRSLPVSTWSRLESTPELLQTSEHGSGIQTSQAQSSAPGAAPNGGSAPPTADADADADADAAAARERKRQSRKRARHRAAAAAARNRETTAVYVSGLPPDADTECVAALFAKCGILLPDPDTGRPRVKLYRDAAGKPKGDALVTYALRPSVDNAIMLLDGAPFRPGAPPLSVQEASFGHKRREGVTDADADNVANGGNGGEQADGAGENDDTNGDADEADKATSGSKQNEGDRGRSAAAKDDADNDTEHVRKRARAGMRSREIVRDVLSWADETDEVARRSGGAGTIVILQNVFDGCGEVDYGLIRADMEEGCGACGEVERVTVFERNVAGTVAAKFRTAEAALKCLRLMDGRWYDGRKLSARFYDGVTDYRYRETEDDRKKRDAAWRAWLESGEQNARDESKLVDEEPYLHAEDRSERNKQLAS